GHVLKRQKVIQPLVVQKDLNGGMLENRFDLRTKNQPAARSRVIQRFNAETVTRQQEPALARIPNGKTKHPAQELDTLLTEILIQMDDHFRIACRPKSMSPAFQFLLKGQIVINLTVEDCGDAPIFVRDRLLSTIQID